MARKSIRKYSQLQGIARKSNGLRRWVARYILRTLKDRGYESNDAGLASLFGELAHGCSSGIVSELIYTSDTHKFFDKFYSDIEELRTKWEEGTGEALKIDGDLKNYFAWFGFEQTAYQLTNELED